MASARAFNTDFNEHQKLVHSFAKKGWARMIAAHVSVEYEDVFQEMSLTYTKAARSYDPSKGYTFTSYVGRAIWNEFNRYAEKYIGEQVELGLISVQEMDTRAEGHDGDMYDVIESDDPNPEEQLIRKQEMINNLRKLTPTAKFLVAQMINPATELEEAFELHKRNVAEETGRSVVTMNMRFVGSHYGIEDRRMSKAIKELKTTYGV